MKPTKKQIKVINTILSIINGWKDTNDLYSPSHYSLNKKQLIVDLKECFDTDYIEDIDFALDLLFAQVRRAEIQLTEDDISQLTED